MIITELTSRTTIPMIAGPFLIIWKLATTQERRVYRQNIHSLCDRQSTPPVYTISRITEAKMGPGVNRNHR